MMGYSDDKHTPPLMALAMEVLLTCRQEGQVERHLWGRGCRLVTSSQAGAAAGDTPCMYN